MSYKNYSKQSTFQRAGIDPYADTYWEQQLKNINKTSVETYNSSSYMDEINNLMMGATKSKFSTVEAKVEEMKERSGLNAYLNKKQASPQKNYKDLVKKIKASSENTPEEDEIPISLKKNPNVLNTLNNIIKDTRGFLSVPAIFEKLKAIHSRDLSELKDWEDPNILKLISKLNAEEKKSHHIENNDQYLGKQDTQQEADPSNYDVFHALMPASDMTK